MNPSRDFFVTERKKGCARWVAGPACLDSFSGKSALITMKSPFSPHLFRSITTLFLALLMSFASALKTNAETLVSDDFSTYPDGALTANPGWTTFSGTAGQMQVSAGKVIITDAASEDVQTTFADRTAAEVYYSLDFSVADPGAYTGNDFEYFALFKDAAFDFTARLDIAAFSAVGYRPGIAGAGGAAEAVWPSDLNYGVTYRAVVRFNFATGLSTLWINPVSSSDPSVSSLADTVPLISAFGFRQASATPDTVVSVSQLIVATTFEEANSGGPDPSEPVISPTGSLLPFTTFQGVASASQSLAVTSANLTGAITVTPPAGLEVSTDDVNFGPSASLPSVGGTFYARIAASAPAGEISSPITLSSTGAADVAVSVSAAVRPTSIALPYGPDTFESTAFPWYTYTVAGTRSWVRASAGGNSFMEINGYNAAPGAVPANAWLVLGPFDFPAQASNIVATFNLQRAFNDAGDDSEFTFKYSSDYAGEGDPASATWSDIAFTKPAAVLSTSTDFTPSGAVPLPPTLAGQSGVYVAFQLAATSPTATSRWRMDQFELFTSSLPVISIVANPTTINEGSTAIGTVSIPEAVVEDVIVTVTSADPTLVLVDNGYGDPPASSCEVPIFAGETSALFTITTTRDFTPGSDVPVQIIADGGGAYTFGQTIVTVRNIDLPSASLNSGGYTQNFAGFVSAETLPLGWALQGSVVAYLGDWGTGTSAGSRGNANVFGYQHTGSSGVVRQILTLRNDTGDTIDALTISYLGMVARAGETRPPSYAVTVDGQSVSSLAYSTSAGVDVQTTSTLTGLTVAAGQTITIAWTSERGGTSGSSRQIGIGNLSIQVGAILLPPSVSSLSIPPGTITRTGAEVSADVTSDGGEAISAQGFVYAETSVNPAPQLGGTGVTDISNPATGVGLMPASLSGLTAGTSYSIAAYATNAQGTTYTPVQTFTTVSPAISFAGGYAEPFNAFDGSLPTGWSALSSGGVLNYGGIWGSGSSAGYRGGVSDPGVLGYQHTAASGTLTVTASFINDTGAPITTLYVSYLGRVERVDQTNDPAWAVSLDGNVIAELAYSTANTSGEGGAPGDELLSAAISGLSIPDGAEFEITWACDRGSLGNASRQIGLANLQVSTSEIPDPAINVSGSLTSFSATEGSPSAAQSFSASGANLTGIITVNVPTNYEVSLDNSTFSSSVTLTPTGGSVSPTPVYVRIAATAPVGNPAGQVSLASPGATTQNIAVTGTVSGGGSAYDTWASGFGLDPATTGAPTADPDGDSFSNAQEYAFGTNPTQGNGSLLSSTASGGNLVVTWLERGDVIYNVQSTGNLATTAFANDGTVSVVDGPVSPTPPAGYTRKQITVPASGSKFYRVTAATP